MKHRDFWWNRHQETDRCINCECRSKIGKISLSFNTKYLTFDSRIVKEKEKYDYAQNCAMGEQVWAIKKGLA